MKLLSAWLVCFVVLICSFIFMNDSYAGFWIVVRTIAIILGLFIPCIPFCDCSQWKRQLVGGLLLLGLAAILSLGLGLFMVMKDKYPQRSTIGEVDAWVVAQEFVGGSLKAPTTAKYTKKGVKRSGDTFTVAGLVDAQNSFGAMLRNEFVCEIKYVPSKDEWRKINLVFSGQ